MSSLRHESLDEPSAIRYLYHEPQLSSLCGVHALNNLLQGPYFGAGDLAEVGAKIDATEARLLHGSEYADRPLSSRHVDAYSGDFSIEVCTPCSTYTPRCAESRGGCSPGATFGTRGEAESAPLQH